jgi:predicted DCC family thiol-disulfide oxidoreductase YuxK
MAAPVLLYDDDCGFCRWALGKVLSWDRSGRIRPVPIESDEGERLLPDLDPMDRPRSWHLVDAGGRRHSAGAAFPPLLRLLPGGRLPARLADAAPGLVDRAYFLVADNRSRLGVLITKGAKRRADARIEARGTPTRL